MSWREYGQLSLGTPVDPWGPVEPVEHRAADLVLLQHHRYRVRLVEGGFASASAPGVVLDRLSQVVGQPQVVHHQPAGFVLEHPVHPGDGLEQPVTLHGLVDIHRVEAGCVESGEPHVPDQHDPERVVRVSEPVGQGLPAALAPDVLLPVHWVGCRAGHHHLDFALGVIVVLPFGAKSHQLTVKLDTDPPAHADDHRLPVHLLQPGIEMFEYVLRNLPDPVVCSDHGLELGPLGLELFLFLQFLPFGNFLELRIDVGFFLFVQGQLGEPALIVDRNSCPVRFGAGDVIDADVVPKDGTGVGVVQFDGGASESQEGGLGQGIPHVPGVPVDKVVLAPVGLIGYDHDVPPVGKDGVGVSLLLREELLDGGEHHSADVHGEFTAEVGPALRLGWVLPEEVPAPGEGAEELVVQVVPVGEDHDGGVVHCWIPDDGAGVEGHGQALPRPLVVPDDSDPPVSRRSSVPGCHPGGYLLEFGGPEGLFHGGLDGVELVVPGDLLDQFPAPVVIEHDEVSQDVQEVALFADAFQHHLELGEVGSAGFLVVHGLPGLEPLLPGGQRTYAGVESVGDHHYLVHREQGGEFSLICLELIPGLPDVGVLVRWVLEFDDAQGEAVQEEDYVRPPGGLVLPDSDLVDGQPVVVGWVFEVDDGRGFAARRPVGSPDRDGYSPGEGVVEGPVPGFQGRSNRVDELAETGFQRRRWEVRVEVEEGVPEAFLQHHLCEVGAFGARGVWGYVWPVGCLPSQAG